MPSTWKEAITIPVPKPGKDAVHKSVAIDRYAYMQDRRGGGGGKPKRALKNLQLSLIEVQKQLTQQIYSAFILNDRHSS